MNSNETQANSAQRHVDQQNRSLIITSWVLIGLICLTSVIPFLGFGSWLIAAPILFITVIMGIIVLARGGTIPGLAILLTSLIAAPVFILVAPFVSSLLGLAGTGAALTSASQPATNAAANSIGGLHPESSRVPSDEKSKALILESLLDFNKAVQDQSFQDFHANISRAWQEQITREKLKEVFQQFIDKKLDISSIKTVDPILTDPPQINSDEVLILKGYYPTHPLKVNFQLKYIYEHPAWKLFGINVNVNE